MGWVDWVPTPTWILLTLISLFLTVQFMEFMVHELWCIQGSYRCEETFLLSIVFVVVSSLGLWVSRWLWCQWPDSLRVWSEELLMDRLVPATLIACLVSRICRHQFAIHVNSNSHHYRSSGTLRVINRST